MTCSSFETMSTPHFDGPSQLVKVNILPSVTKRRAQVKIFLSTMRFIKIENCCLTENVNADDWIKILSPPQKRQKM